MDVTLTSQEALVLHKILVAVRQMPVSIDEFADLTESEADDILPLLRAKLVREAK